MNDISLAFIEDLKTRPDVLGIILFGSWARGNNHPDSDVDLVIILKEGFRRTVEYRDNQAFEMIYTTEESAYEFWEGHKDDAAGLWEVAKILYDKDGDIEKLQNKVKEMLKAGKNPYDQHQLGQVKFDVVDQLNYVKSISNSDPTSAKLILFNKVFGLTELFFDIKLLWIPAPKQRLNEIKNLNPKMYTLLADFYKVTELEQQIKIAQALVRVIFETS